MIFLEISSKTGHYDKQAKITNKNQSRNSNKEGDLKEETFFITSHTHHESFISKTDPP
jgi:hypothetical protein